MRGRMETFGQLGRRFILFLCAAALLPSNSLAAEEQATSTLFEHGGDVDPNAQYDFDIPRLPQAQALDRFGEIVKLGHYRGARPTDAVNVWAGPVKGRMSAQAALEKLMALTHGDFDADAKHDFNIPRLPLAEALERFAQSVKGARYGGVNASDEIIARNIWVGPVRGRMSARRAFAKLTTDVCAVSLFQSEPVTLSYNGKPWMFTNYRASPPNIPPVDLNIPRMSRELALEELSKQFDLGIYSAHWNKNNEDQQLVGPLSGRMSPHEAVDSILMGTGLVVRWVDSFDGESAISIEPINHRFVLSDCSETLLVTRQRLSSLDFGSVVTISRNELDATGANTVPEALTYLSEAGLTRALGSNAAGAQYIDLRGLGPEMWLVLINGRRALPSAVDLNTAAFDLGTVPLSAIQRIEIQVDSGSVRHGTDAIAGVLNIITVQDVAVPQVDVRYGEARDGAAERQGTLSLGAGGGTPWRMAAVLDTFALDGLLGSKRRIPGNQDYTDFGGLDYRYLPGVRTVDGSPLPGTNSSFARLPSTPEAVSLNGDRSLVPDVRRVSFIGVSEYAGTRARGTAELIWARKENAYSYFRPRVMGLLAGDNPYNPYHTSVMVDALLTGRPALEQHVDSELTRFVLGVRGKVSEWDLSASAISSRETTEAWVEHALDPAGIARALAASDPDQALDVFSERPGQALPDGLIAEKRVDRFAFGGDQIVAMAEGPLLGLPAGSARLNLGSEYRREAMRFTTTKAKRSIRASYAELSVPIVNADMHIPGVHALKATGGVRRDEYIDRWSITRPQFAVDWALTDRLALGVTRTKSFKPPSLVELHLPVVSFPTLVNDHGHLVPITFVSGGNEDLEPSSGTSETVYLSYDWQSGTRAQLRYFSIDVSNHISLLPLEMALEFEEYLPHRVLRAEPSGQLLSIDTRKLNYGRVTTSGFDADLRREFNFSSFGSLTASLGATWTEGYEYSDSPVPGDPMIDRAGIADARGSITRWRAIGSLAWQRDDWRASTHIRFVPSYHDTLDGYEIGSQTIWDGQVSYAVNSAVAITFDVKDILNTSPHWAHVGAAAGWDWSQWDPVGRKWSLKVRLSL